MTAYSYDPTNIAGNTKDRMRLELGDTQIDGGNDTCALSDEEYVALIGSGENWRVAKVACLKAIVAKFAMMVDFHAGGMSIEFSRRYERYKEMLDGLEKKGQFLSVNPASLGEGCADGGHYFRLGMLNNPYVGANPDYRGRR